MNINGASSINPYIQSQPPQTTERTNALEQTQGQNKINETANEATLGATRDNSNQAFQVSITDQARQALQTGQLKMEPGSNQATNQNPPANANQTEAYGRDAGQGPSKVIDLVA